MWRPSQSQKSKWTNSQLGRDTCGFLLVNCVVQRKTFLGLVIRLLVSCLLNPFSLYASSATVRQSRSAALCDDFRYLRLCRISGDRSIPLPHPSTIGRTPFDIFCKSPPLPHLPQETVCGPFAPSFASHPITARCTQRDYNGWDRGTDDRRREGLTAPAEIEVHCRSPEWSGRDATN